ncbi:hypothetical protein BGZ93_009411 [Podila epicladia]|nr:hypothetical protein BGZ92_010032 [Podila epicladia]KAG0100619.1 hypothetical protein BGZ93_009411 [Podila epicladia]
MVDTTQSPLAMLVLVTPYTILYLVNQLFLQGVLDNVHYVFFELIFVLAFRKIFGLPDLSEKLFPAQVQVPMGPLPRQQSIKPAKTTLVSETTAAAPAPKKKVKKVIRKQVAKKEVPYAREMAAMETKFFDYINNTEIWEKVFEEDAPGLIQVYQYKERPMCYKVIAVMNNTPAVTFDLLSEISRRVEWDPLCVEAKTIADIAPGTKIQYVRTKGIWPTASRDTVVLGTVKDLGEGTYCNITTSVEHPGMPERVKEKFVRMETAIAGQIIGPEPGFPNKCRLVQVLDADLKGWIPEKVIQMVSTKAVPEGMRNVNKLIPTIEPYTESKIIERVALARKDAEAARLGTGGEENVEDQAEADEEMHELKERSLLSDRRQSGLLSGQHGPQDGNAHSSHLQHNNNKTKLERKQVSTFRVFWEGMKQNLGLGRSGKVESSRANKVVVMTLFLAVLGPTLARWRRSRLQYFGLWESRGTKESRNSITPWCFDFAFSPLTKKTKKSAKSRTLLNRHTKHSSTEASEGHQDLSKIDRNVPKQRRRLSRDEAEYLLDRFREQERPTAKDRSKFAEKLSLHPKTIQIWFQNRRAKMRKDESIARDLRIDREDDDGHEGDFKDSNEYLCGTSPVGSNSGMTENHPCGSGAETFVGFVGSPPSEDFECDPDWGKFAEDKGGSEEETNQGIITIENNPSTFCDGTFSSSPLEELTAGSHLGLERSSFCNEGLDVLTDLAGVAAPLSLEYGVEIVSGKIGSSQPTPACLANINNHIPRHQMGLTLVPEVLLSIYVRDAASSWDLCS